MLCDKPLRPQSIRLMTGWPEVRVLLGPPHRGRGIGLHNDTLRGPFVRQLRNASTVASERQAHLSQSDLKAAVERQREPNEKGGEL